MTAAQSPAPLLAPAAVDTGVRGAGGSGDGGQGSTDPRTLPAVDPAMPTDTGAREGAPATAAMYEHASSPAAPPVGPAAGEGAGPTDPDDTPPAVDPNWIALADLADRLRAVDDSGTRDRQFEAHNLAKSLDNTSWLLARVSPGPRAPFWHVAVVEREINVVIFGRQAIHRDFVVMQLAQCRVADALFDEGPGVESDRSPFDGGRNVAVPRVPRAPKRPAVPPRTDGRDGRFVYFLQSADRHGPIKIGVANSPSRRVAVLGVIPAVGQPGEARLHQQFAAHRLHGEWFEPTAELLAYIAANARPWLVDIADEDEAA
jgi:hypothetical protein